MEIYLEHNWGRIDQRDWDRLVAHGPTSTVFQTFQWHASWWEQFHPEKQLFLIRVADHGRPIGIAPLMIIKKGKWRIIKFMGTGHSDYCDFIYAKDNTAILSKMFKFLMEQKAHWDAMALDYIPENSPTARSLHSICSGVKLYAVRYSQLPCPAIVFGPGQNILRELLEKKSLQRHYNHFQKKSGYQVLHLKTQAEIDPYLDEFFDQHVKRWKGTKTKSLFWDERNRQFYRNCVRNLCVAQWITFTVVRSQGQSIAFHFGLAYNHKFIWYKPSFDSRLSKYSPGEVLLRELLVYAAQNGFDEFDFTIGSEAFKSRFANEVRHNASFKVFQSKRDFWLHQLISSIKVWKK